MRRCTTLMMVCHIFYTTCILKGGSLNTIVIPESTVIVLADWYHTPAPSAGLVPTSGELSVMCRRYRKTPFLTLMFISVIRRDLDQRLGDSIIWLTAPQDC